MSGSETSAWDFFADRQTNDEVSITLADGTGYSGSYITQAGMHFIHEKQGGVPGVGKVHGPIDPAAVATARLVRSKEEVREEIRDRRLGDLVPGNLTRNRDGYEARLERLANICASTPEFRRRMQIEAQFDEVADEIQLARTKRNWLLAVARWRRHSNEEPDKLLMAGGDLTSVEKLQRPRPQDFDPDPAVRRKRKVWPPHVSEDPLSPPNMKKALIAAGFKARVSILSELTEDAVGLLVDFPGGKKEGRFMVSGQRDPEGQMRWRMHWEGGDSSTAIRRMLRAKRSADYAFLRHVVADGLDFRARTEVEDESVPASGYGM